MKGGCRVLKSFFIFFPKLDTNLKNLGQIAYKLWLLSLLYPIYHFWGWKGGDKSIQIILMDSAGAKTYV